MSELLNPNHKPFLDLVPDQATWDALKLKVTDYLSAHADMVLLDEPTMRLLDPAFSDDKIWSQITSDLGLVGMPG